MTLLGHVAMPHVLLSRKENLRRLEMLESDSAAGRKDLPDLLRFMMATGVRIGESTKTEAGERRSRCCSRTGRSS